MNKRNAAMLVLGAMVLGIGIKLAQLLISAYPNSYVMLGFYPNILDALVIAGGGVSLIVYFGVNGVKKQ
jgi:hypothetical protein